MYLSKRFHALYMTHPSVDLHQQTYLLVSLCIYNICEYDSYDGYDGSDSMTPR